MKASNKHTKPYDDTIELLRIYHDQSTGVSILLFENLYNYSCLTHEPSFSMKNGNEKRESRVYPF